MKGILILFFSLTISWSYTQVKTPEKVGLKVFNSLKNLEENGYSKYVNQLMPIELYHQLASDTKIDEDIRKLFSKITQEEYDERYTRFYEESYGMSFELGFDWDDIEFREFIYKQENDGGLKGISGKMYFSVSDDLVYYVRTSALLFKNKYYILFIEQMREDDREENENYQEEEKTEGSK